MNTHNFMILFGYAFLAWVLFLAVLALVLVRRWPASRSKRDDVLMANCAMCGVSFETTPDSFVEVGWDAVDATDEEMEELDALGDGAMEPMSTQDALAMLNKAGVGEPLDAAAMMKLLEDGEVDTGAQAWCLGCRKKHFGIEQN